MCLRELHLLYADIYIIRRKEIKYIVVNDMITKKNALTRYPYINLTMYFDENKENQEENILITNHRQQREVTILTSKLEKNILCRCCYIVMCDDIQIQIEQSRN